MYRVLVDDSLLNSWVAPKLTGGILTGFCGVYNVTKRSTDDRSCIWYPRSVPAAEQERSRAIGSSAEVREGRARPKSLGN